MISTKILLAIVIIFAFIKFLSYCVYALHKRTRSMFSVSGSDAAQTVLEAHFVSYIRIEKQSYGKDCRYDKRNNVLNLCKATYKDISLSRIASSAHEAAYAVQHSYGSRMLSLRRFTSSTECFFTLLFAAGFALCPLIPSSAFPVILITAFAASSGIYLISLPFDIKASIYAYRALVRSESFSRHEFFTLRLLLTSLIFTKKR